MTRIQKSTGAALGAALVLMLLAMPATASDHADPVGLSNLDAGITGLFVFPSPSGESLVVILTMRRGLSTNQVDVEPYTYTVYMDLAPDLALDDAADLARYGGTILHPEAIAEDVKIEIQLDNEPKLAEGYPKVEGLTAPITAKAGIYDDPFIFPRFQGLNVVGVVMEIPYSAFPPGNSRWLVWGTTTTRGLFGRAKQIDHVGRSTRTQLGRFDYLNKPLLPFVPPLHPSDHLKRIRRYNSVVVNGVLGPLMHGMSHIPALGSIRDLAAYTIAIRPYDYVPDVMIYTTLREPGYPNGRRLEDDIVQLACNAGDCVLREVASIEGPGRHGPPEFPRKTVNDVPLRNGFPYLGNPHPTKPQEDHIDHCARVFWLVVIALFVAWIIWMRSRITSDETPRVRPVR